MDGTFMGVRRQCEGVRGNLNKVKICLIEFGRRCNMHDFAQDKIDYLLRPFKFCVWYVHAQILMLYKLPGIRLGEETWKWTYYSGDRFKFTIGGLSRSAELVMVLWLKLNFEDVSEVSVVVWVHFRNFHSSTSWKDSRKITTELQKVRNT